MSKNSKNELTQEQVSEFFSISKLLSAENATTILHPGATLSKVVSIKFTAWFKLYFDVSLAILNSGGPPKALIAERNQASRELLEVIEKLAAAGEVTNSDLVLLGLVDTLKGAQNNYIRYAAQAVLSDKIGKKPTIKKGRNGKVVMTINLVS